MPALTPNSPVSRFEWVIRQYWGKPLGKPQIGDVQETYDGVVLDAFAVTINLVGAEGRVRVPDVAISHELGDIGAGFSTHELSVERIQRALDRNSDSAREAKEMLRRLGHPYEYNEQNIILWDGEEWGLASLVLQVIALPEHNRADFLIPWVARELAALAKGVVDDGKKVSIGGRWAPVRRDYYNAVHMLVDKGPAIAQWAKEARVDIGKVDLATALETIKTYKFKQSLVEQGTVVFKYNDGWTVQELRTENALTQEGKNMQNCVGDYCSSVESGDTRIYSIRDAAGYPHVTMELRVPPKGRSHESVGVGLSPEEFARSDKRLDWYFAQVLGKQNDAPIEEYQKRAREFIDKVFEREGCGWCVAGGTPQWARFAGRQLNDVDFEEITGVNHAEASVFSKADFTDTNLVGCNFKTLLLVDTKFVRARVSEANFERASLRGADFSGAQGHFTDFSGTMLDGASFREAHLGGANFSHAILHGTDFTGARVDGADFVPAKGGRSAIWTDVDLTQRQRESLGLEEAR